MAQEESFLNFAYGSNLLLERLRDRTPSATPISTARLTRHVLRWHKRSQDGSGKCDAPNTGLDGDVVWGVVFRIATEEREALDRAEGLGHGYKSMRVTVQASAKVLSAAMYVAIDVQPDLMPYDWYKAYVLAGAEQHRLPQAYINQIRSVASIPDPSAERTRLNALP